MNILFTILAMSTKSDDLKYLEYCKILMNQLLDGTLADILITTNNYDHFEEFHSNSRVVIRDITPDNVNLVDKSGGFNYNLKFLAFKNLPHSYDIIFYIDCDIKIDRWTSMQLEYLKEIFEVYDVVGTRFHCVLEDQLLEYNKIGTCLFKHKIDAYAPESMKIDNILHSRLPSEHFLIIRNVPHKLEVFSRTWELLNQKLQLTECNTWGDGFEIGISLTAANYYKILDAGWDIMDTLQLTFNGNKS